MAKTAMTDSRSHEASMRHGTDIAHRLEILADQLTAAATEVQAVVIDLRDRAKTIHLENDEQQIRQHESGDV